MYGPGNPPSPSINNPVSFFKTLHLSFSLASFAENFAISSTVSACISVVPIFLLSISKPSGYNICFALRTFDQFPVT